MVARVIAVAVGHGGEVALIGTLDGPDGTVAGTSISGVAGVANLVVALLDSSGALQFVHSLGPAPTPGGFEPNQGTILAELAR